jgi:hypothetical protein
MDVFIVFTEVGIALIGLTALCACFVLAGKSADHFKNEFLSLYCFMVCSLAGIGSILGTIIVMVWLPSLLRP